MTKRLKATLRTIPNIKNYHAEIYILHTSPRRPRSSSIEPKAAKLTTGRPTDGQGKCAGPNHISTR